MADRDVRTPRDLAVIIPVLHEAEIIERFLSHLRALPGMDTAEIIVVDGDPDRSTVRGLAVPGVTTAQSARGRARQMNRGAALASSPVLLFLHADTYLPRTAADRIDAALQDPQVVGGAFDLGIDSPSPLFRITERYVACRTRLTRVPFGDQAIFLRTDYFRSIGGFRDIPIMEDVELMARIRKRGDRISIIRDHVMTSARRWERQGILYGTLRNWTLQLLYVFGVSPDRLARWYR